MKTIFITMLLLSLTAGAGAQSATTAEQIKAFYAGYMKALSLPASATDTLLYRHHYPGQDACPELTSEDSYMELHVQGGIVRKGFFWGTTDMMDHAREGYACGFFVLPMTDITHAMDSVSFTLKTVKDADGQPVNIFTSSPVGLHVHRWEEAVKLCGPWESFTTSLADSVRASIRPHAAPRGNRPEACPLPDSVIVRRWTEVFGFSDSDSMLFVRERRK